MLLLREVKPLKLNTDTVCYIMTYAVARNVIVGFLKMLPKNI